MSIFFFVYGLMVVALGEILAMLLFLGLGGWLAYWIGKKVYRWMF